MSNEIESTIAQLEGWRDRITSTIETLRALMAQGPGLPDPVTPPSNRHATGQEIPHDAFFQMTIPDAAEKYLSIVKHTKSSSEIAGALLNGGLKTAAKNFSETLRSILSREERFVRVNGEWGLSVWYPAMKRERKPRTAATAPRKPERQNETQTEVESTSSEGTPQVPINERILKLLDGHPAQHYSSLEIAKHIGANANSVKAALAAMYKDNKVAKPEPGRYRSLKREAA